MGSIRPVGRGSFFNQCVQRTNQLCRRNVRRNLLCLAVFTHLDERAQNEWLIEMARLLKPNGVFVTTTHGCFTLNSCTPRELADLQRDGIVYRVDRKGRFKVDGLPDFYQTTFHTVDYVKKHWGRFLAVVDHVEGG